MDIKMTLEEYKNSEKRHLELNEKVREHAAP